MKRTLWGICLLYGVAILLAACNLTPREDYDGMRLRHRETLIPSSLDVNDPLVKQRTATLDSTVQASWDLYNKAEEKEFLWADSWEIFHVAQSLTMDYGRLLNMSMAWATPGSRFYGDSVLLKDIKDGLDWMVENHYNTVYPINYNWWEWVIGVPMQLNRTMVLLYDELSPEQRAKYLAAMDYYAPDVTYEGASTGANKVWQCGNMALRGILGHRGDQIKMAIDGLDTELCYVTSGDGFYEDGSFVQHQWHPYNGGYGSSMLSHFSEIIPMVAGSPWELSKEQRDMIYDWIRRGYEPLMVRGAMMDMVRGRQNSREGDPDRNTGHTILMSILKLAQIAPKPEKARLESFVKAQVEADSLWNFLLKVPNGLLLVAQRLLADPKVVPAPAPDYNKIFPSMDRAVHARPGFSFGLAMSSARIENYETINGENITGWYTGDGMTYLYDGDLRQYTEAFWPTVNPYRMPGTTIDTRPRKAESIPFAPGLLYADGYKSPHHWVGGASLFGRYGMAGMRLKAFECTLEAKKSWFMAGDEIVCLGAGINSADNRTVETIVENRKLNPGAVYRFGINGEPALETNDSLDPPAVDFVHMEGVDEGTAMGYYFPEPGPLHILHETRTGSWRNVSTLFSSDTPVTRDYFILWIDHGKNPANGTYAYVLLPGRTAAQTADYAAAPGVTILSNTPAVQAVRHDTEGVTGLNFWEAGTAAAVTVDAPASVLIRETDGEIWIGLAEPTQLHEAPITLQLDRAAASVLADHPNVEVLELSPAVRLRFRMAGALGQTAEVKLKR